MGLEQLLPWAVFLYLGGMSGAGLLAMGLDKRTARRNGARKTQGKGALRRIPGLGRKAAAPCPARTP